MFFIGGPAYDCDYLLDNEYPKKEKEKSWYIYVGLETTTTIIIGGSNLLIRGLFSFKYQCLMPLGLLLSQNHHGNFIYISRKPMHILRCSGNVQNVHYHYPKLQHNLI